MRDKLISTRQKRTKYIALFSILLILLLTFVVSLPPFNTDRVLVPEVTNYVVSGNFAIDSTPNIKKKYIKAAKFRYKDITLWGSWTNPDETSVNPDETSRNLDRNKHTGKLSSPVFKAPIILGLFVAGYPTVSENNLLIEKIETNETFQLDIKKDPGDRWRRLKWFLPIHWWGSKIRIVAIDGSLETNQWLGVSSPIRVGWWSLIDDQIKVLEVFPGYIIHFLFFLLPGLILSAFINKKNAIDSKFIFSFSIAINCLIGYLAFWMYFLNRYVGFVYSISIMLISVVFVICLFWKNKSALMKFMSSKEVLYPLLIMFFVGLFYLSLLYITDAGSWDDSLARWRFFESKPIDNAIPYIFAEKLYDGVDPRNLIPDWLSSDRPPLQTGIVLLQRPIMGVFDPDLGYQTIATIAQCSWIAAVWSLCRAATLPGRTIAFVMGFTIFSGFFLFNSVFVWPKLLAASLVIFAFSLLLHSMMAARKLSIVEIQWAAIATALGLLAHGGVVFAIPGMLVPLILPRVFPGWRRMAIGIVFLACMLAPWGAYQKLYEPPGNRLVKMHLAGVIPIDERSSVETIIQSYQNLSLETLAAHKWENTKKLIGRSPLAITRFAPLENQKFLEWRLEENDRVFKALGVLNVGWLILLFRLFSKGLKSKASSKAAKIILGVSLLGLVFWVLIIFGPGGTTITHSSYAMMILLFTGLSMLVVEVSYWFSWGLLLLQIVSFIALWLLTTPPHVADALIKAPNIPTIVLAAVAAVAIAKILEQLYNSQLDSAPNPPH